jgi:hypothetical protein
MSIVTKKVLRHYDVLVSATCSKCGKVVTAEDCVESQEFNSLSFTGGYGSKFGDGVNVRIDLCQDCLFEFAKDFYEIVEEDNGL